MLLFNLSVKVICQFGFFPLYLLWWTEIASILSERALFWQGYGFRVGNENISQLSQKQCHCICWQEYGWMVAWGWLKINNFHSCIIPLWNNASSCTMQPTRTHVVRGYLFLSSFCLLCNFWKWPQSQEPFTGLQQWQTYCCIKFGSDGDFIATLPMQGS